MRGSFLLKALAEWSRMTPICFYSDFVLDSEVLALEKRQESERCHCQLEKNEETLNLKHHFSFKTRPKYLKVCKRRFVIF